jgi:hypothetical protein
MGLSLGSIGQLAGAAIGFGVGGPEGAKLGAQLGGAAGSLLGGSPNVSGAYNTAAGQSAQAAQMAQFRPVGITTRFGSSQFGIDSQGNLTSAGYALSPELRAIQDYAMTQTAAGMGDTSRLLSLGRGYLAQSPEEARQQYLAQQYGLLAPTRESQLNQIRSNLLRTGRGGLAVGAGGQLAASNPELQAYYNALAQQDLQLAAGAEQEARNRIGFGQGLLSSAYAPISAGLGLSSNIEALGQTPFALSSELAGRSSTAGYRAGTLFDQAARYGLAGQVAQQDINAARERAVTNQLTSLAQNPQISSWFNNIIGGGSTPTPATFGYNPYQPDFGGFDISNLPSGATAGAGTGLWSDLSFD